MLPPKKIGTIEWNEKYRTLSSEESARPGRYRVSLTPALSLPNGPFDAIDSETHWKIIMQKSAQMGYTSSIMGGALARWIDNDPSPIVVVFPTTDSAREYVAEKFRPMIEATPKLAEQIDINGRKANQRQLFTKFLGGFAKFVTANSPRSVKSTAARRIFIEEPDDCSQDVKGQGGSIKLAEERLKTYADWQKKIIEGGTPTIEGISAIAEHMEITDKRYCYVPCHDCGEFHVLSFDNFKCAEDPNDEMYGGYDPSTAYYVCPKCGSMWTFAQKNKNLTGGYWEATQKSDGAAGFYFNELLSTFPDSSFHRLMQKWKLAEKKFKDGDDADLIVFTNSSMGIPYKYRNDLPDYTTLLERKEPYKMRTVPTGVYFLTCGIDVQHNGFHIQVKGWGVGEESWLIEYIRIELEDPEEEKLDDADHPIWTELREYLTQKFERIDEKESMMIEAIGIDSSDGTMSETIYKNVRKFRKSTKQFERLNILPVKGSSDTNQDREIFTVPRKIDHKNTKKLTKAAKYSLQIYSVGTHRAKCLILESRLNLIGEGAGRMHWAIDTPDYYFEELLGEMKVPSEKNKKRLVWERKSNVRNEALDTEVYPIRGGVESKEGNLINNTDFSITPATSEILELTSTMKDTYGQALDTYGGEVTPAQISISFNRASPEVFALALGGSVEKVAADSGSVVDGEFIPAQKGGVVKLSHDYIDPSSFELKDTNGSFVAGEDFNINTDTGVVEIVSDKLATATGVTTSYSYDTPEKSRMYLGTETQFSMRIEFDGINVSGGGKRVKGEIYRAMVTPSEAVNLHSNEPVVATLTGKLSTPAGKKAPFVLEMEA